MPLNTSNYTSLVKLTADLNAGKLCFNMEKKGDWHFTKNPTGIFDKLRLRKTVNLEKLPSEFCKKYINPLEQKPVLFRAHQRVDPNGNILKKIIAPLVNKSVTAEEEEAVNEQRRYNYAVVKAWNAIENAISREGIKDGKNILLPGKAAMASFKYRNEAENCGSNALDAKDSNLDITLWLMAREWKAKQKNYPEADRKMTWRDNTHIHEICRYPLFVDVLKQYQPLRETYFKWSIRDNGCEKSFIEFLNTWQTKLEPNYLSSRIAYHGSSVLAITKKASRKTSNRKKILTLPFEVKSHKKLKIVPKNILDGSKRVTLSKDWQISINEMFHIFGNKNLDVGNLDFFGYVKNWNCQKLGCWDPRTGVHEVIDLTADRWWEALPTLDGVEPIDLQKLKSLYPGLENLKKNEWAAIVRGTRKNPTLNVADTHGFIEIAIPQRNGTYKLYPFGKLAARFPDGTWQLLKFLANTVKAKIYYPDENIYYHFRQHGAWAKPLSDKTDVNRLMDAMRNLLMRARTGDLEFAFGDGNCGKTIQDLMVMLFGEKNIPNFFRASIFDLTLPQPIHAIFALIRWFPIFMQTLLVRSVELTFGSFRGIEIVENGKKVFKSLSRSTFSQTKVNYLPAYLPHQILKKIIPGAVWWGVR